MSIQVSKPGKLYLAGEYAVLSGQSKAIIMQTKAKLHVSIESYQGFRVTDQSQDLDLIFSSFDDMRQISREPYLKEAIDFCYRYLQDLGIPIEPFHLTIKSDLKIKRFEKLGLGSSAALTVATIDACLRFHHIILSPMALYKAAVLAQIKRYPHSSFGDVACSAFDHVIIYQKFNTQWLTKHMTQPWHQLISMDWPQLMIDLIDMPKLPILFIYTHEPADSQVLVKSMKTSTEKAFYESFVIDTDQTVEKMISHIKSKRIEALFSDINHLNQSLKSLANHTRAPLFTEAMKDIETMAKDHHGAFKFSGAGGGDCVITLFKNEDDVKTFKKSLKNKYHIINDMIEGLS